MHIGGFVPDNNIFLAPMAGVTDSSFREICQNMSCGLVYSEMVSAKGLFYGGERTGRLLLGKKGKNYGVQLFGSDPQIVADMAKSVCESSGDIKVLDINCGCPAPKITRNDEGSALMKDIGLASKIIASVVKSSPVPVTAKFRKGWDEQNINAVEFARMAQDSGASALIIHGRTREQFYHGRADWDIISKVKAAVDIPVIGNGDVFAPEDAKRMMEQTGCDGVMVARGAMGNPWIFGQILDHLDGKPYNTPDADERLDTALLHARMMLEDKGEKRAVLEMRKHVAWYIKGLANATKIRESINACTTMGNMEGILEDYRGYLHTYVKQRYSKV